MTSLFADVIHGWLGWCPQALVSHPLAPLPPGGPLVSPDGRRAGAARTPGSFRRFRTFVLFQAVLYSVVFLAFLPALALGNYALWIAAGTVTALLAFALRAGGLWRQYEEIRTSGTTGAGTGGKFIGPGLILLFIGGTFTLAILALLGVIPGLDVLAVPAFCTGFAVLPWPALLLVLFWEHRTGCRLYLDKGWTQMSVGTGANP